MSSEARTGVRFVPDCQSADPTKTDERKRYCPDCGGLMPPDFWQIQLPVEHTEINLGDGKVRVVWLDGSRIHCGGCGQLLENELH